jgi:hypothetical protein
LNLALRVFSCQQQVALIKPEKDRSLIASPFCCTAIGATQRDFLVHFLKEWANQQMIRNLQMGSLKNVSCRIERARSNFRG